MSLIVLSMVLALLIIVLALSYILGFRLGRDTWSDELTRLRAESLEARRRIHDLTRQAFVAMVEEADQRRQRK